MSRRAGADEPSVCAPPLNPQEGPRGLRLGGGLGQPAGQAQDELLQLLVVGGAHAGRHVIALLHGPALAEDDGVLAFFVARFLIKEWLSLLRPCAVLGAGDARNPLCV